MSESDFNAYLEKWENHLLARVLVAWKLVDQDTIRQVYQETQTIAAGGSYKLGQMLIRKRLLQIPDYTKAMMVVRQQAQILYQKSLGNDISMKTRQHQVPQNQNVAAQTMARRRQTTTSRTIANPQHNQTASRNVNSNSTNVQSAQTQDNGDSEKENRVTGSKFGSYEIVKEVARGGMGIVYKAKQLHLNRIVALKVLLSGGAASELEIQRFRREAESAGSLQHPNIVSIYEIGEQDGYHYFTMDFVDGDTLQELIKKKARRKVLLQIMEKVAKALEHAHQRDVVHRDIKPSNIIVSPEWEPKITDFGLAKKLDASTMLTESGTTLGTPFYMAPEQTLGNKEIDGRADIYSMGVILYEILTHRLPFNASTLVDLYHKVVQEDPILPSKLNRKVDKEIELVCLKCMEKDPQRRYQTASELASDLNKYLNGEAVSAKRSSLLYRASRKIKKCSHTTLMIIGGIFLVILLYILIQIFRSAEKSDLERKRLEAEGYLGEGKILILRGQFKAGLMKMEKAIKIAPHLKKAYIARGNAYLHREEYLNALAEYDRVLKIDLKYSPAYNGKGKVFLRWKKFDKAIEHFTKAIKFDANFIDAYVGRGSAYQQRGLAKSSSEDLENAIKDHENADKKKKECLKRAQKYLDDKKYKLAIQTYGIIIRVDPKYALAHFGMAKAYYYQKKWNEAIKGFEDTIKLEPDLKKAKEYLAKSYEQRAKNNKKTQEQDLKKAREIRRQIK